MGSQPLGQDHVDDVSGSYVERLRTPAWWYLGATAVAVLLGAEFAFAVSGWITWVPLLVLVPVCLLVVWRLSAATITVANGVLQVPDAQLDLADVERAIVLSPTELRRVVGRHSDPTAFVFIRSWIGPGVQLVLNEAGRARHVTAAEKPAGKIAARALRHNAMASTQESTFAAGSPEVPYWVISTRRPVQLLSSMGTPGLS